MALKSILRVFDFNWIKYIMLSIKVKMRGARWQKMIFKYIKQKESFENSLL